MNIALFDFDGTITAKDTFAPFLVFATGRARRIVAGTLLAPLIGAYKLGVVSASRTRTILAWFGFYGAQVTKLEQLGAQFAGEVIPKIVRSEALQRIRWHKERGDRVIVISAALDVYLGPWCGAQNLELICTRLERRGFRITGRYVDGDCTGLTKVTRLTSLVNLSEYAEIFAYGDTIEDAPMLALASRKFFRWKEIHDISQIRSSQFRVDEDVD